MPARITRAELGRRAGGDLPRGAAGVLGGVGPSTLDGMTAAAGAMMDALEAGGRRRRQPTALPSSDTFAELAAIISRRVEPEGPVSIDLFGTDPPPAVAARQVEFIETLALGMQYLAASGDLLPEGDPRFDQLIDLALSEAPEDRLRRDILLGGRRTKPSDPGSLGPRIPPKLLALAEKLRRKGCANVAKGAIGKLGAAVGAATPRYRNCRIDALTPPDACPGDLITIIGAGFGDSQDGAVAFTSAIGGAVIATTGTRGTSWSDTEIIVAVPAAARHGPVGVLTIPKRAGADIPGLASAAVGEMGACFGAAAQARAESLFGNSRVPSPMAPSLRADGKNLFTGGLPAIRWFSASPSLNLTPGTELTLSWKVDGCTSVEVVREQVGSQTNELPAVSGSHPATGRVTVGAVPGTRRWKGAYVLTATNNCGTERRRIELEMAMRIGLALGGGGSRGDFQVGALRYIYDVKGVRPDAIAATSVGAINAVELVQGDTAAGNGAARVEAAWRALVDDSSMWVYEPWLVSLSTAARQLIRSFSFEGLVALPWSFYVWASRSATMKSIADSFGGSNPPNAFYNIGPIEARMTASFDPANVAKSKIALRLVAVSLETGEIVHVTETGGVLGKGTFGQTSTVIAGAMASAAMPAIFPPVRVGNHMCVDGGVRDVVPVQTAVRDLGCHVVYAIRLSAPPMSEPFTTNRSLAAIAARAVLSTTFDEVADDDVAPFRGWGPGVTVHVIESTFDIHDPTLVDPGLIDIGINYGWMRAADVLDVTEDKRQAARDLSDEITSLRVQNWEKAHRALFNSVDPRPRFGFSVPSFTPAVPSQVVSRPDRQVVVDIRNNCRRIRDLVVQRNAIGASVRAPVEPWFTQWETIPFQPWTNTPWDEYTADSRATLAAEAPPTIP